MDVAGRKHASRIGRSALAETRARVVRKIAESVLMKLFAWHTSEIELKIHSAGIV
jgi:hypothetical protein